MQKWSFGALNKIGYGTKLKIVPPGLFLDRGSLPQAPNGVVTIVFLKVGIIARNFTTGGSLIR